jgi:PadR family transcriptional regulator PadR
MESEKLNSEIKKGLLVLSVLQVISGKKVFVGDILITLKGTDFSTQEGTLYPLLSRLKRDEYITYEWVESPSGPPRKYYQLSDKGNDLRKELLKYLKNMTSALNKLGEK